eukprot:scaffold3767_cov114-Isochrysis_galbana.AAC.47
MDARANSNPLPTSEAGEGCDSSAALSGCRRSTRSSCSVRGGGTAGGQWNRHDLPARIGTVPAGVTSASILAPGSGRTTRLG